jgi:heterodisulfide reductase subunit C2
MDRELATTMDRLAKDLWQCQQCGECSSVCPSGRYGGIRCAELMAKAALGSIDPSDPSFWLCACCQSCSERCPSGVDTTQVITHLRTMAAERGHIPPYFREEAKRFLQTGLAFPKTGMTKKMRQDLGLEDIEVSESARNELKEIAARTRLGRLGLE